MLLEQRVRLIGLSIVAGAGTILLAHQLDIDEPTLIDRRVRRITRRRSLDPARVILKPLFPMGLPGGYITIAYMTARWLRRRDHRGGPAIIASAWLGWLVHRAAKVAYFRERPRRPGTRRRIDSYPSGHTTGATALALTAALVLRQEKLMSSRRALAIAVGVPAIMGSYRVIADDHWTTDVAGGWLLGASIGLSCYAALGGSLRRVPRVVSVTKRSETTSRRSRHRGRPEPRVFSA